MEVDGSLPTPQPAGSVQGSGDVGSAQGEGNEVKVTQGQQAGAQPHVEQQQQGEQQQSVAEKATKKAHDKEASAARHQSLLHSLVHPGACVCVRVCTIERLEKTRHLHVFVSCFFP